MTKQEAINQLYKMEVTDRDYEAVKVAIDAITKTDELENMEAELERLKNCRHECKIVCLLDRLNELQSKLEHITAERDDALDDLKKSCRIPYGGCNLCKNKNTSMCKECNRNDCVLHTDNSRDCWKWRSESDGSEQHV